MSASRLGLVALALAFASSAAAATPAPCGRVLSDHIYLPDGTTVQGGVTWEDGRIVYVGSQAPVPSSSDGSDCWMLDDDRSVHVTAGLVAAATHMGLVEVELEAATRHHNGGGEALRAAFRPAWAYNPASVVVPVSRSGGITTALVHPTGGFVSGMVGAVHLLGRAQGADPGAHVIADQAGLMVYPDHHPSHAAAFQALTHLLDEARFVARNASAIDKGTARLPTLPLHQLKALGPVLKREVPVVVRSDRASEIANWAHWAVEQRVGLVIEGGAEAWRVTEALLEAGATVMLDPTVYGSGSFDEREGRPDNAALLHAAGVPVVLLTHETHNARTLRTVAGNAVRGGLPHAAAMAGITSVPAVAFGLGAIGHLQAGADADMAIWSGDPLEVATRLEAVLVQGEAFGGREDRQRQLQERWAPAAP